MTIKTSELIGPALDWAVAKAKGYSDFVLDAKRFREMHETGYYNYSTEWSQGGPIIERELIDISAMRDEDAWLATTLDDGSREYQEEITAKGRTPLIAAMRCYVASKLGNEVELPKELA